MLEKNLIVNGEYKSGKTSAIIMPIVDELITKNKSLLFIDKNYEYYKKYVDKLQQNGYEVRVLNFDDLEHSDSLNILELPYKYYKDGDKDKAYELVNKVVGAIFPKEVDKDPFWSDSAISLVRGYILKLFELACEDEINFLSVSRFLNILDEENSKEIIEFLMKDSTSVSSVDLAPILYAPYETRASILSVARLTINRLVNYQKKLNIISNDGFKFSDLLDKKDNEKKYALFLIPNLEDSKNELISMIISEAYQVCQNNNWYFILDSFDMLGNVDEFKEMFMASNYRNIYMVIGTRDIDMLVNKYGKEILQVCDIKDSKQIDKTNISNFQDISFKEKLPNLEYKKIKVFNLLEAISKQ